MLDVVDGQPALAAQATATRGGGTPAPAATGSNLPPNIPVWMTKRGADASPYGERSSFEQNVLRKPESQNNNSTTPLQDLHGTITPNSLFYERTHAGVPNIDPTEHRLMVHGMVARPTLFTMDDLKRFPAVSVIHFMECSGNSGSLWAPSGAGGTVQEGQTLFAKLGAPCHGPKGEGSTVAPRLVGGIGTLASNNPIKTVGRYWSTPPTLYDFIRLAMPANNPQSLTPDETYALVAYLLYLDGIVDESPVMDTNTLPKVVMPNHAGYTSPDPRPRYIQRLRKMADARSMGHGLGVRNVARVSGPLPRRPPRRSDHVWWRAWGSLATGGADCQEARLSVAS